MNRRLIHNKLSKNAHRRELRHKLTSAEAVLWLSLRKSQLGAKFRRQHSIGPYIADFFCPEFRVVLELDGAGHKTELGAERDARRDHFMKKFGIRVMRIENRLVFQNLEGVLEGIKAFLRRDGCGGATDGVGPNH
jgi:very-short-patch-repair endonuclease